MIRVENNTKSRWFKHSSEILTLLQILHFPNCFFLVSIFGSCGLPGLAEILLQARKAKKAQDDIITQKK